MRVNLEKGSCVISVKCQVLQIGGSAVLVLRGTGKGRKGEHMHHSLLDHCLRKLIQACYTAS